MDILHHLGYDEVRDNGNYFQFKNLDGDNPSANCIYKDTLSWQNFTRGLSGNIITLVMDIHGFSFPQALEYIQKCTKIEVSNIKTHKPFNGFYSHLTGNTDSPEAVMKTYSDEDLPPSDSLSKMFLDDGVDLLTQERYGIRYCHDTNQIIIPERNINGQLVGAKQRNNDRDCRTDERWGMYIPFSKSLCVFGYSEHYREIIRKKVCVIFEAEKSVMIGDSNNFYCGLAIGGHNISPAQARYIKSLGCSKIILAFDEGINNEEVEFNAKKLLINNSIYQNKIGFIDTTAIEKGTKNSPIDSFKVFKDLMKNNIIYIN